MGIPSFVKNRSFSYEISCLRDDRWLVEAAHDSEDEAQEIAHGFLRESEVAEVKVIRYRESVAGGSVRTEIFHEKSKDEKNAIALAGVPADTPVCDSAAAFYGLASRMAMSRLFKNFLAKFGIVTSEILYNATYAKKLMDEGALLGTAIHKVAARQAELIDVPKSERVHYLERQASDTLGQIRVLSAERRKLPNLQDDDLAKVVSRVRDRFPGAQFSFVMNTVMAQRLNGAGSAGQKLEILLAICDPALDEVALGYLDNWIADCLCFSEIVEDLFGVQPNLAQFLIALTELLYGDGVLDKEASDSKIARLGELLRAGRLPASWAVLLDWFARALANRKPLDWREPEREKTLLEEIVAVLGKYIGLTDQDPRIGNAISARRRALRQVELRDLGLVDAADALS